MTEHGKFGEGDLRGTLRAVVHPSGMNDYPGKRFWTRQLAFSPVAWRLGEGPVRSEPLIVLREIPIGTAGRWRRRIAPGAVISFESSGLERTVHGALRLRMTRFLGPADDPELSAAAAPALTTDVRETAEFGALVRKPGDDIYTGRCDWHGRTVELWVSGEDEGDVEPALKHARALHAGWASWEARLRALTTAELLPLWLDWHAEEPPIDGDALYGMLTLESVWVMDDGTLSLTMDPAGQFTDHTIRVDGSVEGGPEEIDIEG